MSFCLHTKSEERGIHVQMSPSISRLAAAVFFASRLHPVGISDAENNPFAVVNGAKEE